MSLVVRRTDQLMYGYEAHLSLVIDDLVMV